MNHLLERLADARFITWSIALHVLLLFALPAIVLTRAPEPEPRYRPVLSEVSFLEESREVTGPPAFRHDQFPLLEETIPEMEDPVISAPASQLSALTTAAASHSTLRVGSLETRSLGNLASAAAGDVLSRGGRTGIGGLGGSGAAGLARIQFLGVEQAVTDVMFVVDVSSSMASDPERKARCERVFKEVDRVIRDLPPEVKFNIIAFGARVVDFRSQMVPASDREKMAARPWLRRHNPASAWRRDQPPDWFSERRGLHLATKIYEAMEEALKSQPKTILFVCDGEPSRSRYDAEGTLVALEELLGGNFCNVVVNTFSVAADEETQAFMEELARIGRGTHQLFD